MCIMSYSVGRRAIHVYVYVLSGVKHLQLWRVSPRTLLEMMILSSVSDESLFWCLSAFTVSTDQTNKTLGSSHTIQWCLAIHKYP